MKKTGFAALGLCLILAGCSPERPPSEVYLQSVFDRLNIALSYEHICENGKHLETMNVNLFGNMQNIVAIYSGELIKNYKGQSFESIKAIMDDRKKLIDDRMKALLEKEGCKSEPAQDAAKFLKALLESSPPAFFAMVADNLEKVGGSINLDSPKRPPETAPVTPPETR